MALTRDERIIDLARQFLFVREDVGKQNQGRWVEVIQRATRNKPPDSWCASFVAFILGIVYAGKPPLPFSASCDDLLYSAKLKGWLTDTPNVGDVYLCLKSPSDAHHTGFVTEIIDSDTIREISGNTNTDGSSNGIGVFERTREVRPGKLVFIHYPR